MSLKYEPASEPGWFASTGDSKNEGPLGRALHRYLEHKKQRPPRTMPRALWLS